MSVLEEIAHAKINLALHVRARRADGYHDLETLFAFAEHGDALSVTPSDGLELSLSGPFAADLEGSDNLVLCAAEALRHRFGISEGAHLHLVKNLPVASGIGGGSADAAAALRLLARWWGLEGADLLAIAAALGADVPACLASRTVRGEGRGDNLISAEGSGLAGMPLLLVNPLVPLSTAAVFAAWDGEDRGPLSAASPLAAALEARNDLEAPALSLVPGIGAVLEALRAAPGAILARMSGSGATCFALFEAEAERDAAAAGLPASWWRLASRLR